MKPRPPPPARPRARLGRASLSRWPRAWRHQGQMTGSNFWTPCEVWPRWPWSCSTASSPSQFATSNGHSSTFGQASSASCSSFCAAGSSSRPRWNGTDHSVGSGSGGSFDSSRCGGSSSSWYLCSTSVSIVTPCHPASTSIRCAQPRPMPPWCRISWASPWRSVNHGAWRTSWCFTLPCPPSSWQGCIESRRRSQ